MTAGFDLMKSLFITIFGIGILTLILSFTVGDKEEIVDDGGVIVILDPTVGIPPKDDDKKDEVKKDEPAKKAKVVVDDKTDATPTPKDNPDNQTEMRDNVDLSTVVSGDTPSDGDDNGIKTPEDDNPQGGGTGEGNGNDGGIEKPEENNKIYSAREVTEMAIFPGCEKFAGNKTKLTTCMSEQLNQELGNQLDFETTAQRQGISEAVAKIQFVIDKSGKIVEVKTINGGNVELSKESKEALERISKRMVQKGKYIKPAKFDDGTPVNLIFTIPVKFVSN